MQKNIFLKRGITLLTLLLTSIGILYVQGCGQSGSEKSAPVKTIKNDDISGQNELRDKGKKIAGHINSALISALTNAIDKKGLEGAVDFCSVKAIPITDSISAIEGVSIKRISHKPRNENNMANKTELQIISRYKKEMEKETSKKQPVIISENGKNDFYAPIYITSSLCLNCHGKINTDIQPGVYKMIQAKYPSDMATGFEMNELRGLLKISDSIH